MLNNFDFIKSCFGPDDDEEEKFEIKHKKERKVSYHPNNQDSKTNNKKKGKKSRKNLIPTQPFIISLHYIYENASGGLS